MSRDREHLPQYDQQGHKTGLRTLFSRYAVKQGWTLADADLEAGDFLPEHSDYLIVDSKFLVNKAGMAEDAVVNAVQPSTYTGANPFGGGLVELSRTRHTSQVGTAEWSATRRFICPNADIETHTAALLRAVHPTLANTYCLRPEGVRDWLPGFAEITAQYKTIPTYGGTTPFSGSLVELKRTRDVAQEGTAEWSAVRRFVCPNAAVDTHTAALLRAAHPSLANTYCLKPDAQVEWIPDYALVTAYYKTIPTYNGGTPFSGGLVELKRTRGLIRRGEEVWQGQRTFVCPNALANLAAQGLWDQLWPEAMGDARCRHYETDKEWIPDYARIEALYKTLRTPGKARLLTRMEYASTLTPETDLDGKIIQGPCLATPGALNVADIGHEWQVIRGAEFVKTAVPYEVVILQTAFYANQFQLQTGHNLYRKVNNSDLPNFGNAARGTMLFIGQKVQWEWGDALLYVDYYFQWSGNNQTWNEMVQSRKGVWLPITHKAAKLTTGNVFELADAIDKNILVFVPGKTLANGAVTDAEAESRRLFEDGDFSTLNALVEWSA